MEKEKLIELCRLGAVEMGLGAVWVGVTPVKPAVWGLKQALGLPR